MNKTLNKIEACILYAIIFLVPITTLPISPNIFVVGKLSVLVFGVILVFLLKAVRVIYSGKLEIKTGKFDFPVLLIIAAYLASALLRTPNKMEAFLLPGTATIITTSGLLYFLLNQLNKEGKKHILPALFFSGTVFSAITLLAFSGLLAKIPQLPAIVRSPAFTPEGGFLPSAIFLGVLLPIGVSLISNKKKTVQKTLLAISSAVIVFGFAISVYNLIPGKPFSPKFPNFSTDWNIAIDALKNSPILGVGPGNYLTAFNRYRPLSYNNTELWAVKYSTARSFYLTVFTETGLLGTAGIIMLLLGVYRTLLHLRGGTPFKNTNKSDSSDGGIIPTLALALLLIILVFFPATLLTIAVIFILLASSTTGKKTTFNLTASTCADRQAGLTAEGTDKSQSAIASKLPALLVSLPVIAAMLWTGYHASQIVKAEYTFNKGINALAQNRALDTYNLMIKAINTNPQVDRYRSTYARVNLALANSIASKPEIAEVDRANITQLIQQAITEAKTAVALNPLRAGNWEMLGRIYQSIIPLAQGADAFAVQTFRNAVSLDPINPNTRIALGGVYYETGDFANAVKVFELAVVAKPNHANARYNLAFALREAGQLDRAITEMTNVLSLVDRTTNDYEVARVALEDMQTLRQVQGEKRESPVGEELIPPQGEQE
ncbi:tetratricopeptide repeat protein, partial [Patescibacteria group bacterium]|nr:tetratricopeptide repeat protein [Patescibacteria group bacterium]